METNKKYCDKVVEEWIQIGGLLNSFGFGNLFMENPEVYNDWIKENNLIDTVENQKEYCRIALAECGLYSEKEINEFLQWE